MGIGLRYYLRAVSRNREKVAVLSDGDISEHILVENPALYGTLSSAGRWKNFQDGCYNAYGWRICRTPRRSSLRARSSRAGKEKVLVWRRVWACWGEREASLKRCEARWLSWYSNFWMEVSVWVIVSTILTAEWCAQRLIITLSYNVHWDTAKYLLPGFMRFQPSLS